MKRTSMHRLLMLIFLFIAGCNQSSAITPARLTVMAASSLTEAFIEIGTQFEAAYPGVKVTFNFAGSQQLAQQLSEGAPADVFASANLAQMDTVIRAGRVNADAVQYFTQNRLVVILPQDNPAGIQTLQDLATPGLKIVLAAKEVPVGAYSLEFFQKAAADPAYGAAYAGAALANVVSYEQSAKAVLAKVLLDEADAGIVYTSDIRGEARGKVEQIEIPTPLNITANYPIVVLKDSANIALAEEFVKYILSVEAQAILVKYGFLSAGGS